MDSSNSKSSGERVKQAVALENAKGPESPRSEYEEYLDLNREFTGKRLQKLVRKVDWHVLPQLIIIYLLAYIDRNNVGNARLFGAEADMKLSGQDWNTGLSVFFVTYAAGGVPSNIALKRFGPRIWLPFLLFCVSLIIIGSSMQINVHGWLAFRVLLGWFEAGVFPGCSFILTTWYNSAEIHTRMAIFFCAASGAGAFSGLLAYGIGHLDGTLGFRGWRWIYCLEGLFSFLVAVSAWFVLNDTPTKVTKWLTPEERRFLVLRARYAAGGETGIAETETFSWKAAREAFTSFHIYAIAATQFTVSVAVYGYTLILPTIVFNLGYTAAVAQVMTAPPYIFAALATFFTGWAADRWQQRMFAVVIPISIAVCGFIIMMITSRYPELPGATLFGVFLATGGLYPVSPAVTAWIALNCAGSMKRAVGIGAMLSFSQLGGIVGSNIYIKAQSPTYPIGFGISLGMLAVFGVVWPAIYWVILKRINAKRAAIPVEEIHAKYTEQQLSDMGDLSPLFRPAVQLVMNEAKDVPKNFEAWESGKPQA
ncbi:MFS nicotinic acid transporter [Colletotrichum sojae]|uniref:MFS nicotinic acid transporter n=1 Tax=Colletotrichum sojae TaxID=2175907 RepID=A0A8H6JRN6_9PEZI|nr:MFS nicotinic acid transporter [Colletotrichum sojae]